MRTQIEKSRSRFPKNATFWSQATDEIRDLARESREHLTEYQDIIVEPLDFRVFKTPAEWNTQGRKYILANFDRMNTRTQELFYERFQEWFVAALIVEQEEAEETKPWAMQLADGTIKYFDTNDQMIAYSVRPEVIYRKMGATQYIVE